MAREYDMLDWMIFHSDELGSFHLEAPDHPSYSVILESGAPSLRHPNRLCFIKSSKGFPYDIRVYDDEFIYDWITELSWTDYKQYKRFLQPVPIAKRMMSVGDILPTIKNFTYYEIHDNIKNAISNLGDIKYELEGPLTISLGGDLPTGQALRLNFFWGITVERYWFQWPYGLVQWSTGPAASLTPTKVSTLNKIVAGLAPVMMLPPELS